jgi:hypothetical protein
MDGIWDSRSEQAAPAEILPNRFGTHRRGNLQSGLIIRKRIFIVSQLEKRHADYSWRTQDPATRSSQDFIGTAIT